MSEASLSAVLSVATMVDDSLGLSRLLPRRLPLAWALLAMLLPVGAPPALPAAEAGLLLELRRRERPDQGLGGYGKLRTPSSVAAAAGDKASAAGDATGLGDAEEAVVRAEREGEGRPPVLMAFGLPVAASKARSTPSSSAVPSPLSSWMPSSCSSAALVLLPSSSVEAIEGETFLEDLEAVLRGLSAVSATAASVAGSMAADVEAAEEDADMEARALPAVMAASAMDGWAEEDAMDARALGRPLS